MWQHCVYTESDSVGRCVYDCDKVIGIEDSSAGIVSIKLVGFSCVGMTVTLIRQE